MIQFLHLHFLHAIMHSFMRTTVADGEEELVVVWMVEDEIIKGQIVKVQWLLYTPLSASFK